MSDNKATTIDGHEAWIVESHLTFDITGLDTKGELLILAIVQAGTERSGLPPERGPERTRRPERMQYLPCTPGRRWPLASTTPFRNYGFTRNFEPIV